MTAAEKQAENPVHGGTVSSDGPLDTGMLENLLGYQLRRAQNALFQHFESHLKRYDITPGRLGLLLLIAQNPGVSQSRLAKATGVERSTLGEFIERFVAQKLVERRRTATDRRIYAIHLTAKGRRFLDSIEPEVMEHEQEFGSALSKDELKTLLVLLKRLRR
jgi:DNA-binding MarR family transcriptional regulator